MRTNLLVGAAAVGVLITGAIAQTSSHIERIKDPAGHQNSARDAEAKKGVRTVYPNTQNAEQAAQQSKSAQGQADASKRKPGDVTPLPNAEQPSSQPDSQAATQASPPPQQSQQSAQTPSTQQIGPATSTPQTAPGTQSTQAASPPPAAQTAQPGPQPAQPSNAPPATKSQSAPTATAQQSNPPSQPQGAQPRRQGSTGIVALDIQQQTSIGQAIARRGVKPVTTVNFSIAVGSKVPSPVHLRALPSDIVAFVPQYRGYSYVVVEEQIVIVDPATQEIAAIVPYTGSASATRTADVDRVKPHAPVAQKPAAQKLVAQKPVAQKPMVRRSVNLNTEEKVESRRPATEERRTTRSVSKREYRESERAPRTVTIEQDIEPSRVPVFRGHRFVDDDNDDDVIVAPRQNGFFGFFR